MTFEVDDNGGTAGKDDNSNIPLIIGIVCSVVILLGIAFYMIYRSRKAKHSKAKTRTKKRRTRRE
jgi:LPXTG-motif cell wall-anchored protein